MDDRFAFGKNWAAFLAVLNDDRIKVAEQSVIRLLGSSALAGHTFLDIGSGSGLFSLCARRLGARVHSFDYDADSVACTRELRRRFFPDDADWKVEQGSVLDNDFMRSLGRHDFVYSWGVLHHTGAMWQAFENAMKATAPGGTLAIAIYNDMGEESSRWWRIKKRYVALPEPLRPPYAAAAIAPYELKEVAKAMLRLSPGEYFRTWTRYHERRGMSRWHDIVDWVGGFPYEYASVDAITSFAQQRGFAAKQVFETHGLGCNEFTFVHTGRTSGP